MKQLTVSMAIVTVLTVGSLAFAQMIGGGHGQSMMQSPDSAGQSGKMGMMGNTGMMENMSGHCKMMSQDFDNLGKHLDKMMKMDDIAMLKAEMKNHHEMMQSMHERMSKHMDMCQHMMSMSESGDMHGGMMDKQAVNSPDTSEHSCQR